MKPHLHLPGVPAAGHISRGYWHPGRIDGCLKCTPTAGFYTMCERNTATPTSPVHIRYVPAGEQRRLGGGVAATTLCGAVLRGWDLPGDVTDRHVSVAACTSETGPTCIRCARVWEVAARAQP